MHNYQWFSSFDLAQGYLQMPVDKADIHKTAFWAGSSGLYEFTRMPFELLNLRSSFCHLMEMSLGDQQFVTLLLYLEDICIFVTNVDEMLDQIEMVFRTLKDFNLKIKPKKCHFFQCSVVFMGYVISADGISANPEKVGKMQNWPVPSNQKELHSFLGLASYYRHFIPKFALMSKCLHKLVGPTHIKIDRKAKADTTKDSNFQWTDEHQKAFHLLKAHLTRTSVLGYLDFSCPLI